MAVNGAGLLGVGSQTGAGAGPQGFTGQEEVEDEAPNVDPEEQQQYDMFVKNGMEILYKEDGTVEPQVLQRLSTGSKPIDTLAQTTVWLVMLLEQDAQRNNQPIEDDVLMHGGRELMEQLIEIAEAADLHEFKEAEIQGAWYQALDMYREANSDEGGRFNPEEAAAAFEALNEADKEGRAGEVLPGFEQNAEQALARAQKDQNPVDEEPEEDTITLNKRDMGRG